MIENQSGKANAREQTRTRTENVIYMNKYQIVESQRMANDLLLSLPLLLRMMRVRIEVDSAIILGHIKYNETKSVN